MTCVCEATSIPAKRMYGILRADRFSRPDVVYARTPGRGTQGTVRELGKRGEVVYLTAEHRGSRGSPTNPLPTIGSRRWISIASSLPGAHGLSLGVGQGPQLALDVLGIAWGHRLFEEFVNDREEVVQGPDRRQRRSALAAEGAAGGAEEKSRLNNGQRDAALIQRSCRRSLRLVQVGVPGTQQ